MRRLARADICTAVCDLSARLKARDSLAVCNSRNYGALT